MSHNVKLTLKVRYRVQTRLFRSPILVAQVQEHHTGYYSDADQICGPNFDYLEWRDAQVEDLSEMDGAI